MAYGKKMKGGGSKKGGKGLNVKTSYGKNANMKLSTAKKFT